jgi:8-oxo-dGTP diphosphatase
MKMQELARVLMLPSVSTVVLNDKWSHYLVAERRSNHYYMPNHWQFAGGMLEHGETIKEASLREVTEEIGTATYEYIDQVHSCTGVDLHGGSWLCVFNLVIMHGGKKIPKNPEPKKHSNWMWRELSWSMPEPHLFGGNDALRIVRRMKIDKERTP